MASNLKVDIVRPTATNGSLSLKGDSGGSATTNGVTVDSSGNTSITGTTTVSSLVATTADINGGTIDNAEIGGNIPAAVSATALDVTATSSSEAAVITQSGTGDALRITHDGTSGNALVVEDSANPDSTPFVVDNNGKFIVGTSSVIASSNNPSGNLFSLNGSQTIFRGSDNSASNYLEFIKERSGGASVLNNDNLGQILFEGSDGTNPIRAAEIRATVDGTPGTNDMPGRLMFSTTADNASSPTERMRIDSSGNVRADKFTDLAGTGAPDFTNGWKSEGMDAYACRAWVNFNGTGTVAIRASGNVSSITDNGAGNYLVNFTNAMPDANYATPSSGTDATYYGTSVTVRNTSSCQVRTFLPGAGYGDSNQIDVAVFR